MTKEKKDSRKLARETGMQRSMIPWKPLQFRAIAARLTTCRAAAGPTARREHAVIEMPGHFIPDHRGLSGGRSSSP